MQEIVLYEAIFYYLDVLRDSRQEKSREGESLVGDVLVAILPCPPEAMLWGGWMAA